MVVLVVEVVVLVVEVVVLVVEVVVLVVEAVVLVKVVLLEDTTLVVGLGALSVGTVGANVEVPIGGLVFVPGSG